MICENYRTNEKIVKAIREFHKTGNLPANTPGVQVNPNNTLTIDYGYNGQRNGSICMTRGQFEIISATTAANNPNLTNLQNYNHQGTNDTRQKFIDALSSQNIINNQTYVSALIILTSECSRSEMVLKAVSRLLRTGESFSFDVWSGLSFAFNNYDSTASYVGINIQAGANNWRPLRFIEYQTYINQKYNGAKETALRQLNCVRNYIDAVVAV